MDQTEADLMYREVILELYREPHNFGKLTSATHTHHGLNPLCGDDITMYLLVKGKRVKDVRFDGAGCAICMACASLLTDHIKDKELVKIQSLGTDDIVKMLGIPIGPVRLKCALLPLETLQKAITKGETNGHA